MFVQVFAGQAGIPGTLQRFARNMPVNYAVNYADSWLLTNGADVRICAPFVVASVAQLVEQLTLNQLVQGSSPCRGTNLQHLAVSVMTAAAVVAGAFLQIGFGRNAAKLKCFGNVFLDGMLKRV